MGLFQGEHQEIFARIRAGCWTRSQAVATMTDHTASQQII